MTRRLSLASVSQREGVGCGSGARLNVHYAPTTHRYLAHATPTCFFGLYASIPSGGGPIGAVVGDLDRQTRSTTLQHANASPMCANRRAAHIRRVVAANPSSLLLKKHRSSEAPPSSPGSPIPIFHCSLLRRLLGMAEPKNSVPNDPRSTPNIGRTEPRSTALSVPDTTPVTAQRHCREQRTYRYTCGTHRAPVHRSYPIIGRPDAQRLIGPAARAASPIHSSPRGRPLGDRAENGCRQVNTQRSEWRVTKFCRIALPAPYNLCP